MTSGHHGKSANACAIQAAKRIYIYAQMTEVLHFSCNLSFNHLEISLERSWEERIHKFSVVGTVQMPEELGTVLLDIDSV